MRSMQALTFDQTATVTRRSYTSDGAGGQTVTITAISLPCRVAPANSIASRAANVAGQPAEFFGWRVTFAAGADVRKDDWISVAGHAFEVVAVLGAESRETARVVLCAERVQA